MIDFGRHDQEAEVLRGITDQVLAERPLQDDNQLLEALQAAGFLTNTNYIGYTPAAIYYIRQTPDEPGAAELFAGRPLGERGLVSNGGAALNYQSMHWNLLTMYEHLPTHIAAESGSVMDCRDGQRLFVPSHESTVEMVTRRGRFVSPDVLRTEFDRIGIDDLGYTKPSTAEVYVESAELRFNAGLREAAKWVSYTLKPPYNLHTSETYTRTLTFDEATLCLSSALQALAAGVPRHDIDIVHDLL